MKEFLEGYSTTVNAEWPHFLAQRFHALTLHFDRVARQFIEEPGRRQPALVGADEKRKVLGGNLD